MELTAWLGLAVLVVGAPLNVLAAWLLLQKSRQAPHLRVLRERYTLAVITTLLVIIFGVIFVNNDQDVPPLADTATKLITRALMLVMAVVPAASWIRLYHSSKQKEEE